MGMTIEEAIKRAEEEAIKEDELCKRYDRASGYSRSHDETIRTTDAKRCEKIAQEHRQLAEWLKDYKRLLESSSEISTGSIAQERYQDLIDYFGNEEEMAKTILEDGKEFKAWLGRVKWHGKRADELARELEQLKSTTKYDSGVEKIEIRKPCINYEDGCEEWAGCPCVHFKARK